MKIVVALIVGLIGLALTTCGVAVGLPMAFGGDSWILVLALPCIGVGALLLWLATRLWKSGSMARAQAMTPPSAGNVPPSVPPSRPGEGPPHA